MERSPIVSLLPLRPSEMSVAEYSCWLCAGQLYEGEVFAEEEGRRMLPTLVARWARRPGRRIEDVSPETLRQVRLDRKRKLNGPTYTLIVEAYEEEEHDYAESDRGLWIALAEVAIERADEKLYRAALLAGVVEVSGYIDNVETTMIYDLDEGVMAAVNERRKQIRKQRRSIPLQQPVRSKSQERKIRYRQRCDQQSRSQPLVRSL